MRQRENERGTAGGGGGGGGGLPEYLYSSNVEIVRVGHLRFVFLVDTVPFMGQPLCLLSHRLQRSIV